MTTEEELRNLSGRLHNAQIREKTGKEERIRIEEQIALLIPTPEVGQKTVRLTDGSSITVKRGLNYKADLQEIACIFVDANCSPVPIKYKTTQEFDIPGYEWYRKENPIIFNRIAEHVTVTPKKVNVTLKAAKGK